MKVLKMTSRKTFVSYPPIKVRGFRSLSQIIILLSVFALASTVHAMNFGSVAKNDFAYIGMNQSAKFTLLFWTSDDAFYDVKVHEKYIPDGWAVVVRPENFSVNRYIGKEAVSLENGYVRAVPVNVYAKPYNCTSGNNTILMTAVAGTHGSGVSFLQERSFKLNVQVDCSMIFNETTSDDVFSESSNNQYPSITGLDYDIVLTVILIIIIIVVSFLIYKYS